MYFWLLSTIFFMLTLLCITLLIKNRKPKCANTPLKILAVAGSGGHTTELLRMLKSLPNINFKQVNYIVANSDKMSSNKIKAFEEEKKSFNYKIKTIPRSREVGQSWLSSIFYTLYAFLCTVPVVWRCSPDLLLINGPGTCIPVCIAVKLLKSLGLSCSNCDVIFVESICRVSTLSMTGNILYNLNLTNKFYVHWKDLIRSYPKCIYLGGRIV